MKKLHHIKIYSALSVSVNYKLSIHKKNFITWVAVFEYNTCPQQNFNLLNINYISPYYYITKQKNVAIKNKSKGKTLILSKKQWYITKK